MEATKFTEVGFHGRDVDQIIRDLVDNAIILTKQKLRKRMQEQIAKAVEDKVIEAICGPQCEERTKASSKAALPCLSRFYRTFELLLLFVQSFPGQSHPSGGLRIVYVAPSLPCHWLDSQARGRFCLTEQL